MNEYWVIMILCTISIGVAQILKYLVNLIKTKQSNLEFLYNTGNMPSSHSSLVGTLVMSVLIYNQFKLDILFVVVLFFGLVVIHDAFGVRYQTGKHAIMLNEIKAKLHLVEDHAFEQKKLKESLGHKPLEVFVGVALGVVIALAGMPWINLYQ